VWETAGGSGSCSFGAEKRASSTSRIPTDHDPESGHVKSASDMACGLEEVRNQA